MRKYRAAFILVSLVIAMHPMAGSADESPLPAQCGPAIIGRMIEAEALSGETLPGEFDQSSEGKSIHLYYDEQKNIRFMEITYFGEFGKRQFMYHILNSKNIFINIIDYIYNKPIHQSLGDTEFEINIDKIINMVICEGAMHINQPRRNNENLVDIVISDLQSYID